MEEREKDAEELANLVREKLEAIKATKQVGISHKNQCRAQGRGGEDEDMEFEEEEQNPHLQNSDWYVTKSCMFLAATRFFVNQRFSSSQQLKFMWQLRGGINLLPPLCVNVHSSVCCAICSVISVSRAR